MSIVRELVAAVVQQDEGHPIYRRGNLGQQLKQKWMGDFEHHVTSQDPSHSGKIDWDTATFHYNSGKSAKDAADFYVARKRADK
jgi:hypothetical protein